MNPNIAEPYREVITNHLNAIRELGSKLPRRAKDTGPRVSDAEHVLALGEGPHINGQYDPKGHITLNFRRKDTSSEFAAMHIEDVDINSFFFFLICSNEVFVGFRLANVVLSWPRLL
jgi:hypothetical protein